VNRYEIRLSGSGGQGIILAGLILAEALAGKRGYVAQSQSYGPEARGTNCMSEVIVSDDEIDYPRAISLDALLALNQDSCDAYCKDLKPDGILLVDSVLVKHIPLETAVALPFTEMAVKAAGNKICANMAALGALTHAGSLVSPKAVEQVIARRSPRGSEEANIKAFRMGLRAAKKQKNNQAEN